jgi:hypothetical protein
LRTFKNLFSTTSDCEDDISEKVFSCKMSRFSAN